MPFLAGVGASITTRSPALTWVTKAIGASSNANRTPAGTSERSVAIERLISVSFQQVDVWLSSGRDGADQAAVEDAGHDDTNVPRTRRAACFSDKRCERHPE